MKKSSIAPLKLKIIIPFTGMNQREFCVKYKLPEDILSKIIHRKKKPSKEERVKIKKGLGSHYSPKIWEPIIKEKQ